ncbi:MAG: type II toxin-antitoxin system VapC family toxin [Candidatus Atabeyarchaeum deiterrae]|jgi:predicted nucleic acid-binding protein
MEFLKICIDTDVLIDNLRYNEKVVNLIADFENRGVMLSTTTVNAFELYYGAYKSRKPTEGISAVTRLLDRLVVMDFDVKVAETAGRILNDLELDGKMIGFRDIFIGATALVNDCAMLTRNVDHFESIPDLKTVAAP